jgi:hypothetical protein
MFGVKHKCGGAGVKPYIRDFVVDNETKFYIQSELC